MSRRRLALPFALLVHRPDAARRGARRGEFAAVAEAVGGAVEVVLPSVEQVTRGVQFGLVLSPDMAR